MIQSEKISLSNSPLALSYDNFTPVTRTPWAGTEIHSRFKSGILSESQSSKIGESWEFSCGPEFPSKVLDANVCLAELIAADPEAFLSGFQVQKRGPQSQLLVKLLNASEPLSLQVHPEDKGLGLQSDECGKPESWLVLDAKPGCGLYLGFSQKLSRAHLMDLLESGKDLKPFLQFVEAHAGDYFEIDPGVPHAIGPGVVLLEPQRVLPGLKGKTYRIWDWGRKYNHLGRLDPAAGKPRELHINQSLELVDPKVQSGSSFVESLRRKPKVHSVKGGSLFEYPMNANYQVFYGISDSLDLNLNIRNGYASFTVLKNDLQTGLGKKLFMGRTYFLPANCFPLRITAESESEFAFVVPQGASVST